ncbi:MAG TPA: hypothetical protein VFP22_03485 [Candidatus Limnocylindrales bacterium]|nr:hypothetical protein [Candidatus Limnocylindrales bacterium]
MTNHRGFMPVVEAIPAVHDDPAQVLITRPRGGVERLAVVHPNEVHAVIIRRDGSVEDLGVAHNLRTNNGADVQSGAMGGLLGVTLGTATSTSATSFTKTAAGWTVDAFKGMRIVVPVTGLTTEPVYGNIGTNSATVITVDQWWTAADGVGTTPGNSAGLLMPGMAPARFIGLTTDTGAAAAGDSTLASELTTNGMTRALAAYAHSASATSYTQTKTFTATGSTGAIHKAGMFTALTTTAGGLMLFETVLNADATLASGDQLALTWTVNI